MDNSLNAVLMLSYVALRQGDSVGMLTFSDEIHGFLPARGGMNQMNRLVHASFNRFPRLVESRYDEAFRYLAAHNRRRSLVVLITNVIDEVNASQIDRYLANLVGRHLPLGVLLRDRRLFEAVDAADRPEEDAVSARRPREILAWRHQVLADMEAKACSTRRLPGRNDRPVGQPLSGGQSPALTVADEAEGKGLKVGVTRCLDATLCPCAGITELLSGAQQGFA